MKRKRFEWIMMRNTFAVMIPVMVFLIALIIIGIRYSFFHAVRCYDITDVEPAEKQVVRLYEAGATSVRYHAKDLYYTGYDYLVEDKIKGAYYYCIVDDHMLFFLVKTEKTEPYIAEKTVKGRILKDEVVTQHILAGLAKNGGISTDILEGFYDNYVISEPDYPYVYTGIAFIIVGALSIVYVFVVAYIVYLWMHPYKHPQAKQLRAFGRRSSVIDELDEELFEKLYFKFHGIYVTENYMIASYLFHTDVIRLDDVRYLSKNRVEGKNGRELYRLTLSEPETDLFYEIDFKDEELIDACVEAIRG